MLERASQRWNPELRFRSHNCNTGDVLVQRAVRLPRVEREVRFAKFLLGSTVLRGHDLF